MPPRLRPPSRVEPVSFPVFGMSWFADPGTGQSLVAYCGGGGSSRTGINNAVVILDGDQVELRRIGTEDKVGVAVHIFQNPQTRAVWLVVAFAKEVYRYLLPECQFAGSLQVDDPCYALSVNAMADQIAVGCENGKVKVYGISDDRFDEGQPLWVGERHDKAVCSLSFSMHGDRLMTSAKDGLACVWQSGQLLQAIVCPVPPDKGKGARKNAQVLVRGCAFCDIEGRIAVTVASTRRGAAVLCRWVESPEGFVCADRNEINPVPISAMSLAQDGMLLALGSVDGSIILWSMQEWKQIKKFAVVHEMHVTCIAARPFPVPLAGEEDGVQIHARSASADGRLGCLTLQRSTPRKPKLSVTASGGESLGIVGWINRILYVALMAWILSPLFREAHFKCGKKPFGNQLHECLLHDVLIASTDRPGIIVPPY